MIKLNHNLLAPVDNDEINRRITEGKYLSIPPDPPFIFSCFKYTISDTSEITDESLKQKALIQGILVSLESMPETVSELIESLCCKTIYKNKILAGLKQNNWRLDKTITRLLKINLKNYQPRTKEVVEKLILFEHLIKFTRRKKNASEMLKFIKILNLVHDFINRSYESYYCNYLDADYFKLFIEKLKIEYHNHPLESLAESLIPGDWIHNEKILRDSLAMGSKYVNKEFSQTGFVDYIFETDSYEFTEYAVMKIHCLFGADIPKNSHDINRMRVFIENYCNHSAWRKKLNESLSEVYKMKPGSIIEFIPCKDRTLTVRHIAGSDCTAGMNHLITDPDSMFYKIKHINKWIGYVCLLSLKLPDGISAVVIDVINFKDKDMHITSEMLKVLIDNMSKDLKEQGVRYILIPEDKRMLTNNICGNVYQNYNDSRKVSLYPGGDLSLDNILKRNKGFHSLYSGKFLVVGEMNDNNKSLCAERSTSKV